MATHPATCKACRVCILVPNSPHFVAEQEDASAQAVVLHADRSLSAPAIGDVVVVCRGGGVVSHARGLHGALTWKVGRQGSPPLAAGAHTARVRFNTPPPQGALQAVATHGPISHDTLGAAATAGGVVWKWKVA